MPGTDPRVARNNDDGIEHFISLCLTHRADHDLHARLGTRGRSRSIWRALNRRSVSERYIPTCPTAIRYFGQGGHRVASHRFTRCFRVAEPVTRDVPSSLRRHEQRLTTLLRMSRPGSEWDREVDCGHG